MLRKYINSRVDYQAQHTFKCMMVFRDNAYIVVE